MIKKTLSPIQQTSQYKLDKNYYIECYEQSVGEKTSLTAYLKAIILLFVGIVMLLTLLNPYASSFVITLGILDALSVRFKKPWWLMRQMISKSANSEVTLTITEQGVKSHSYYVNKEMLWIHINKITKTSKGFLFYHNEIPHYLSSQSLNDTMITLISNKMTEINK